MRARCMFATGEGVPSASFDDRIGLTASTEFPLTVGNEYVVYGFTTFLGAARFYVLDDDRREHPIWYPATLFEVTDESIPNDWVFGFVRMSDDDLGHLIVSFPEWALDPHYYERLVDGDREALEVFSRRRRAAEGDPAVNLK